MCDAIIEKKEKLLEKIYIYDEKIKFFKLKYYDSKLSDQKNHYKKIIFRLMQFKKSLNSASFTMEETLMAMDMTHTNRDIYGCICECVNTLKNVNNAFKIEDFEDLMEEYMVQMEDNDFITKSVTEKFENMSNYSEDLNFLDELEKEYEEINKNANINTVDTVSTPRLKKNTEVKNTEILENGSDCIEFEENVKMLLVE